MEDKKKLRIGVVGVGEMTLTAAIDALMMRTKTEPDVIVAVDSDVLTIKETSLQKFAEHLTEMNVKEVQQLAKVLKEEYGIDVAVAAATVVKIEKVLLQDINHQDFSFCVEKPKKEYHVSKKIGKICGKPKGKYRK